MPRKKPVAQFRVYPGTKNSRIFVEVLIWRTFTDLKQRWNDRRYTGQPKADKDLMGWCDGGRVWKNGKWVDAERLAYVHLCVKEIGCGMSAHEFAHAAFRWIDRKKLKFMRAKPTEPFTLTCDAEEEYCLAIERMVRQFYSEVFSRKLAKPG